MEINGSHLATFYLKSVFVANLLEVWMEMEVVMMVWSDFCLSFEFPKIAFPTNNGKFTSAATFKIWPAFARAVRHMDTRADGFSNHFWAKSSYDLYFSGTKMAFP